MRILVDADTKQFLGATILRAAGGRPVIQVIGTAMRAGVHYPVVRDALPIPPTMAEFIPSAPGHWSLWTEPHLAGRLVRRAMQSRTFRSHRPSPSRQAL